MKYLYKLTQMRLKEVISYNPENGKFIWLMSTSNRVKPHTIAGHARNNGYQKITIDGEIYFAHRLAWLYMTGEWPKNIDHINNIRDDNRFCNLREATHSQNGMNRKTYGNKSAVAKGVYKYRGKFAVRVCLGTYKTREEAIKVSLNFYINFQNKFLHSSLRDEHASI